MIATAVPVLYRRVNELDVKSSEYAFVAANWLKSYKASEFAWRIRGAEYFREHEERILSCLAKSQLVFAHAEDDPSHLFGFAVFDGTQLHYVYVKAPYRRLGMGQRFLAHFLAYVAHDFDQSHEGVKQISVSHFTKYFQSLANSVGASVVYEPYRFLKGEK